MKDNRSKISQRLSDIDKKLAFRENRERHLRGIKITALKKNRFQSFIKTRSLMNAWKLIIKPKYLNKVKDIEAPVKHRVSAYSHVKINDNSYEKMKPLMLEYQKNHYKGDVRMNILYIIN